MGRCVARLAAVLVGIGVLVVSGCSAADGDDGRAATVSTTAATTDPPTAPTLDEPSPDEPSPDERVRPAGFATTAVAVTDRPGADPCELCLWLADDAERRRRGLRGVTELEPAVGMAFVFEAPRTTAFTMRDTLLPLSIAFFGSDGEYLDGFDMEPCTAEPCPSYPTPDDVAVAVEVPQGMLDELGLVPGSRLELLDRECDTPSSH